MNLARRAYTALLRPFTPQDHFAPHPSAGFEGYYSRVLLEDGELNGTVAVIFCWVKGAKTRPNFVHVSYTPAHTHDVKSDGTDQTSAANSKATGFEHESFPEQMQVCVDEAQPDGQRPFSIEMPGVGVMQVGRDHVSYVVSLPSSQSASSPAQPGSPTEISIHLTQRTPWSGSLLDPLSGPLGSLISRFSWLLPLNWHVYSVASEAHIKIGHNGSSQEGTGVAHIEKNWGCSFPKGWIWSQSFGSNSDASGTSSASLCLAGGEAFSGVQAYLVGYRSRQLHWDFRPPFAVGIGPVSPFMRIKRDSRAGTFSLQVQTFTRKLEVDVASPDLSSFMGISCPLEEGHRPMYAFENFRARTWVRAYVRRWPWRSWTLVEASELAGTKNVGGCCALEFGGCYWHGANDEKTNEKPTCVLR